MQQSNGNQISGHRNDNEVTCSITLPEDHEYETELVPMLVGGAKFPLTPNASDNRDREENQTTKPDADEVSGSSDCS